MSDEAHLHLQDGTTYSGKHFGAKTNVTGEVGKFAFSFYFCNKTTKLS